MSSVVTVKIKQNGTIEGAYVSDGVGKPIVFSRYKDSDKDARSWVEKHRHLFEEEFGLLFVGRFSVMQDDHPDHRVKDLKPCFLLDRSYFQQDRFLVNDEGKKIELW